MELIQVEQIRFTDKEKNILDNAYNIIIQVHEQTTNYTLAILTGELLNGLKTLEDFYE